MAQNLPQIIMVTYFLVPIEEGWNDWGVEPQGQISMGVGIKMGLGNDQNITEKAKVSFHKLLSE